MRGRTQAAALLEAGWVCCGLSHSLETLMDTVDFRKAIPRLESLKKHLHLSIHPSPGRQLTERPQGPFPPAWSALRPVQGGDLWATSSHLTTTSFLPVAPPPPRPATQTGTLPGAWSGGGNEGQGVPAPADRAPAAVLSEPEASHLPRRSFPQTHLPLTP